MNSFFPVMAMILVVALLFGIAYWVTRPAPVVHEAEPFPNYDEAEPVPMSIAGLTPCPEADPFPETARVVAQAPHQPHDDPIVMRSDVDPFPETTTPPLAAVEPFPVAFEPINKGTTPIAKDGLVGFDGKVDVDPFPQVPQSEPLPTDAIIASASMGVDLIGLNAAATTPAADPFPEAEPEPMIELQSAADIVTAPEQLAAPFPETETPAEVIAEVAAQPVPCSPVDGVSYEEIRKTHLEVIEGLQAQVEGLRNQLRIADEAGAFLHRKIGGYEKILACVRSYYNASDKRWLTALKKEYLK